MLSTKRAAGLNSILHLWKTENSDWVKQRKEQWRLIPKAYKAKHARAELKEMQVFFMEGVYKGYIPPATSFCLIPIIKEGDMKEVWNSGFFYANDKEKIFRRGLRYFHQIYPEIRVLQKYFRNEIMGTTWRKILELDFNGSKQIEISWNPNLFAHYLIEHARSILEQEKDTNYSPYFDCMDYFYSCLENADDPEILPRKKLDHIFHVIELIKEYPEATKNSLEVAAWLEGEKEKMYRLWPFDE